MKQLLFGILILLSFNSFSQDALQGDKYLASIGELKKMKFLPEELLDSLETEVKDNKVPERRAFFIRMRDFSINQLPDTLQEMEREKKIDPNTKVIVPVANQQDFDKTKKAQYKKALKALTKHKVISRSEYSKTLRKIKDSGFKYPYYFLNAIVDVLE